MAHDHNAPNGDASDKAAPITEPETDSWDPASTIGYEAADPSLHAAFWTESLNSSSATGHLR
jgi:hypothetical protein